VNNKSFNGVYLVTATLRKAIMECAGHETFQEAFDRTGRILNVMVAPVNSKAPARLLNYLTAPHVLIWSAALASSAVPGVFEPVPLLVREADGSIAPEEVSSKAGGKGSPVAVLYQDGSMDSDLPTAQLSELFNVNHFIVSQANPHSVLLSSLKMGVGASTHRHPLLGLAAACGTFVKDQLRAWLSNVVDVVAEAGGFPRSVLTRGLLQVLLQEYEGRETVDITIFPWRGDVSELTAATMLFDNPTRASLVHMISVSERNAWAKLPQVKAHCEVEVCLEQCVQHLRRQLIRQDASSLAAAQAGLAKAFFAGPAAGAADKAGLGGSVDASAHVHGSVPVAAASPTVAGGWVSVGPGASIPARGLGGGVSDGGGGGDGGGGDGDGSSDGTYSLGNEGAALHGQGHGPGHGAHGYEDRGFGFGCGGGAHKGGTAGSGISRVPSFFTSKSSSDLASLLGGAPKKPGIHAAAVTAAGTAAGKAAATAAATAAAAAGGWVPVGPGASLPARPSSGLGGGGFGGGGGRLDRGGGGGGGAAEVGDEYTAPLKGGTPPPPPAPASSNRPPHRPPATSLKSPAPLYSGHAIVDVSPLRRGSGSGGAGTPPSRPGSGGPSSGGCGPRTPTSGAAAWSWYANGRPSSSELLADRTAADAEDEANAEDGGSSDDEGDDGLFYSGRTGSITDE